MGHNQTDAGAEGYRASIAAKLKEGWRLSIIWRVEAHTNLVDLERYVYLFHQIEESWTCLAG